MDLIKEPMNDKATKEEDIKRELRWRIENYLRGKSEPERIGFQNKVWESIDKNESRDEFEGLEENEINDMLWRKHNVDHQIALFDQEYPGVKKILINQIKNGDY